jgi:hypothetical protein
MASGHNKNPGGLQENRKKLVDQSETSTPLLIFVQQTFILIFYNLDNRELLIAQVFSCEEFKEDRFEKIYGIDILFAGEESVITYFVDDGMATKVIFHCSYLNLSFFMFSLN